MITLGLLHIMLGVITPMLQTLSFAGPAITVPAGVTYLAQQVGEGNHYLPITEFCTLIVAGLAFDLVLTGAQFMIFLRKMLPFI